jgi:hypothetical protein
VVALIVRYHPFVAVWIARDGGIHGGQIEAGRARAGPARTLGIRRRFFNCRQSR